MVQTARGDVHALRAYLRSKAPFLGHREAIGTGVEGLDQILQGGLPKASLTVITGLAGAGRTSLAARVLAAQTQRGRPVAWIDAQALIYPPALDALGVDLSRLLMVRGSPDKATFAAEQIIDTGAFEVVVLSGLDAQLNPARARRLQTASEGARVATVVIAEPAASERLQGATLKLHLTRRARHTQVEVTKDRSGMAMGRRYRMYEE